jgi:hypothetical protein
MLEESSACRHDDVHLPLSVRFQQLIVLNLDGTQQNAKLVEYVGNLFRQLKHWQHCKRVDFTFHPILHEMLYNRHSRAQRYSGRRHLSAETESVSCERRGSMESVFLAPGTNS